MNSTEGRDATMDENITTVDRRHAVSSFNLPNALTVLRLVLVPVFIWMKFQDSWAMQWAAFAVFAIAAITDRFDGQIARSRGLITDFGRIADPIADKALTLSAFAVLSWEQILPWWLTILIAVRELGITAWRAVLLRSGIVVSANSGGKLKTVLQIFAIGTLLIPWAHFVVMNEANLWWAQALEYFGLALAGAALAVTLWSGWVYVMEGVRLSRSTKGNDAEAGADAEVDGDADAEAEGDAGTAAPVAEESAESAVDKAVSENSEN